MAITMPIGIPQPPWDFEVVAPTPPSPWTSDVAGYYYIDPGFAGATNSGRTYGNPTAPRVSMPNALAAGAYVEIHASNGATYATAHTGGSVLACSGTVGSPIFIRGADNTTNRPTMSRPWHVSGSYAYFENLYWDGDVSATVEGGFLKGASNASCDHLVLRSVEIKGDALNAGSSTLMGFASGTGTHSYIVVHNCILRNNGNVAGFLLAPTADDPDAGGMSLGSNANHIWVLDNLIHTCMGTALQINAGTTAGAGHTLNHIYVGRNEAYHCLQGGIFTKQCADVIISQNISHEHYGRDTPDHTNTSAGKCYGHQYCPARVWFIYNIGYGSTYGHFGTVSFSPSNPGPGVDSYIALVGNRYYDIEWDGVVPTALSPDTASNPAAIHIREDAAGAGTSTKRYVINNTIDDCLAGIYIGNSSCLYDIQNNIVSNRTSAPHHDINFESTTVHGNAAITHALIYAPGDFSVRVGSTTYSTLASYQALAGTGGANFQTGDPAFTDRVAHDFTIPTGSPAKDAGTLSAIYQMFQDEYGLSIAIDPAGTVRPQNSLWDLGAFEFDAGAAPPADDVFPHLRLGALACL